MLPLGKPEEGEVATGVTEVTLLEARETGSTSNCLSYLQFLIL